jgi:glucoamylase
MTLLLNDHPATGGPGIPPRWARSDKDCVGTAYSALSEIWFTVSRGTVNEVYYPTVDQPQVRDLLLLVGDGSTFIVGEREMHADYRHLGDCTLGFEVTLTDPDGRFTLVKEILTDPYHPCLLMRVRLSAAADLLPLLKVYALLAPHLEVGGKDNNGHVVHTAYGDRLAANRGGTWLLLAASVPFARRSCGYVGSTDGWQDLHANHHLTHDFDSAGPGNIALVGEVGQSDGSGFVLGLAFGGSLSQALTDWTQAMAVPFDIQRAAFVAQWQATGAGFPPPGIVGATGDGGRLARLSRSLILAHEDKRYDGALIASLSIPWGETHDEDDLGGYHLVWTRDLYNSATGLLAAGDTDTPLRALVYLACTQRDDGSFPQNFWIDGTPYWGGIQLDESAFPILLARHLHRAGALGGFDPYPMVRRAAAYLLAAGPVTPQDRWEENGGFSPSTLAAVIAGVISAAAFSRERGDVSDAVFLEDYADFLETRVDGWTVTTSGTILPDVPRHYVRMNPADPANPHPDENPDHGELKIRNLEPGTPNRFPAREIVDAGFLELVRYGIRKSSDPLIVDSLKVVDGVLAVDAPGGRCWKRYTHDGYGQRPDGGSFIGWGVGHGWPVLTGERGHYELAAGRDARTYLRAMEGLATPTGLIPEQVWSLPDLPAAHMEFGKPTGGATPLVWAHGEYLKLARSIADGRVFDLVPEVVARYAGPRPPGLAEVWTFRRQPTVASASGTLRIQAGEPFRLRWTLNDWSHFEDTDAKLTGLGASYTDLIVPVGGAIKFTFFWPGQGNWEGSDFAVAVR